MGFIIAGLLIVGGVAASGYLAHGISQVLASQGRNQNFNTVDEVADDLRNAGRPDLAQSLLVETSRNNTAAFNLQGQQSTSLLDAIGLGGSGLDLAGILPLAIVGLVAWKVLK